MCLDLVVNHVAREHQWARRARAGERRYRDYVWIFRDRTLPDAYEQTLPDVFPDLAPGSFTWDDDLGGLPVLWVGDELGLVNDPDWRDEPSPADDNRWVHRPWMPWPPPPDEHGITAGVRAMIAARARLAAPPRLGGLGSARPA